MKRRIRPRLWVTALGTALLLGIAGMAWFGPHPPLAAAQEQGVSLTIYNQDLALVRDVRSETLKAGANYLRLTDVAAQVDPSSVILRSLTDPAGTRVLEQNYIYDLASSDTLLAKYQGQEIRVVTQDSAVYTGTLLSSAGDLLLQAGDGTLTMLRRDGIREINFPKLPEGLVTRPTLECLLETSKAGEHTLELTYLTADMNWTADYQLLWANDEKTLDLNGWVTLNNRSGAGFEEARVKLVAGTIHRVSAPAPAMAMPMAKAAPAPEVAERQFFEYHLYEIQRPITLPNNTSKQIEFISAAGVKAQKRYSFEFTTLRYRGWGAIFDPGYGSEPAQTNARVVLEFVNSEDAGLGLPLPAGRVRIYKADVDGTRQLIGEDTIAHTPKDETLRLYVGDAFDLIGERRQTDFTQVSKEVVEESFSITLRNHKDDDVTVDVLEHLYRSQDWEITEESTKHEKVSADMVKWVVEIPKDGEETITYTVRYRQ